MNLNIKLDIDPKQFGKSGTLAWCCFCMKTTEYKICCSTYKGLNELSEESIPQIAENYDLSIGEVDDLYQALGNFIEDQEDVAAEMQARLARFEG